MWIFQTLLYLTEDKLHCLNVRPFFINNNNNNNNNNQLYLTRVTRDSTSTDQEKEERETIVTFANT